MTPPRQKRRTTPQNYSQGRSQAANIGKRGLYHCNYCQKEITGVVRIKCAVCPDFDLCLDCFSVGVEITPHQNDHAYRVMDCLSFPLFHPDWGADEEQLLLDAIDMAGFGNWTAVSEHVGSKFKEECKGHYFDIYVNSPKFPEPWPAPQMAGVDPIAHQKAKQARLRHQEQQTAASAAGGGPQGGSLGVHESMAAESGVQQAKQTAVSTDAETAHGPAKRIKLDPSFRPKGETNNNSTISHPHAHPQQAAASGVSHSSPADHNADVAEATEEAGGETNHPITQDASPKEAGFKHLGHNRTSAQTDQGPHGSHPTIAGGHPTTAGGTTPADLQEGEAGESTPNLAGSSRVPAGHMDHGLPAEGLRMHSDGNAVTEGVTAAVTGHAVSGRAAHNATNASQALNKKAAHSEVVALAGFHIKRQEFEPEYDNEAEMIVADMEFKEDDTEEDIEEKVRVIEIYNIRLTERERRRQFVMNRKLINVRKQQTLDRRRNPAERELYARLKAIARYLPQHEFEVLSDGVVTESRLRARIQELKEYRRAGIRTFADAEVYEADKKRRSTVQPTLTSALPGSLPRNWQYGMASADSSLQGWGAMPVPRTASATVLPPARKSSGLPVEGLRGAASALAAWRARRGVALDITALPGMAILSSKERELCAQVRLLPVHYLELKALMMREGQTKGYISRQEARSFFRLEPAKAVRVYELLISSGWIPGPPESTVQAPMLGSTATPGMGEDK